MIEYEKATLEEYGFKDYKVLRTLFNIFNKVMVVLIILMLYLSIIVIAVQSVNSSTDLAVFHQFTLKWYGEIFKHDMLTNAIRNTFVVSISATALSTILGTLIAIGINSLPQKKRQRLVLFNNIPLLNADIVTGVSLMCVFSLLMPIFPYIFGFPTLLLAHLFFTLPYVILSVLPKLKEMDPNMMDAATDLGVRPYKALRKVIVPAIKSGIFSGMLLAFTMSFDDFVISYFTTGNGFDNLSIWIYGSIGRKSLTPAVYAFSTLLTIITLAGLLVVNIINKKKVTKK
jgi:spermidine/putrescine transport system permease protein